jgi:hypothetical protein
MTLTESFSELPRDSDDCLYRAIDSYLKVWHLLSCFKPWEIRAPDLLCSLCLSSILQHPFLKVHVSQWA